MKRAITSLSVTKRYGRYQIKCGPDLGENLSSRILVWFSVALSPRKLAYLWLEKKQFTYNRKRLLIAVSENVKKNVQANYLLPEDYFGMAYPGVDCNPGRKNDFDSHVKMLRAKIGIDKDKSIGEIPQY